MKSWPLGILYLFIAFGLLFVSGGVLFGKIDPYSDKDASLAVCKRGGDRAPECASESADKVLDALLSCNTNFFQVLKEKKAVFGRTQIKFLPYNLLNLEEPRTTEVTFVEPIEAFGLTLVGYSQDWTFVKGASSEDYRWGFRVAEQPDEVVRAIEARHPETNGFRPYGWKPGAWESEDWRLLIWTREAPDFSGTNVDCFGGPERNGMEELPYAPDLFLSHTTEARFVNDLKLFNASVAKTIAQFR
ncbi:hypothetical protein I6F07_08875 [Ensifer sp. IC4062]|nr:hypothetical protein [Ensifer sp. IC4062]MCA1440322.1 hypothetical protein [Ensifer sp. IC4062]